jgi:hypothetical protein
MTEKIKNKKGLSTIISILIIIGITMIAGGIIWSVSRTIIQERMDYSKSCSLELLENINIDTINTHYNKTTQNLELYITIGGFDIEKVIVYVTYNGETKTTALETDLETNSGKKHTIVLSSLGFSVTDDKAPEAVKIAPMVNKQQCSIVDTFYQIPAFP